MAYYADVPLPPTDRVIVKPLALSVSHDDGGFLATEETIIQSSGVGETDVIVFNMDTREITTRNVSGGTYPTNRDVVLGSMVNDGTTAYPFYMPQRISTLNGSAEGFRWYTKPDNTITIYPGKVTLFGREWANPYARELDALAPENWDGSDPMDGDAIYFWCYVYARVNTSDSGLNRVEFAFTNTPPVWTSLPIDSQLGENHPTFKNSV